MNYPEINVSSREQVELQSPTSVFDMRSQATLPSPYVLQEAVSCVSMVP